MKHSVDASMKYLSAIKNRPKAVIYLMVSGYLFNSLNHLLNYFLRITEDHHGFIHVEELVI